MAQILRPNGLHSSAGTWNVVGGGTFVSAVDEVTPDDNDYVETATNPTNIFVRYNLTDPPATPLSGTITVRVRAAKSNSKTSSITPRLQYAASSAIVFSEQVLTTTPTTYTFTTSVAAISGVDWVTYPQAVVYATTSGGGPATAVRVYWIEVEVPDGVSVPSGTGNLSATASLSGSGLRISAGSGALSSAVTLDNIGQTIRQGSGSLSAAATMVGTGGIQTETYEGTGHISAAASLSGTGQTVRQGDGEISATASLSGTGLTVRQGDSDLSTTVSLDSVGLTIRQGNGDLSTDVVLSSEGETIRQGDGDLFINVALTGQGEDPSVTSELVSETWGAGSGSAWTTAQGSDVDWVIRGHRDANSAATFSGQDSTVIVSGAGRIYPTYWPHTTGYMIAIPSGFQALHDQEARCSFRVSKDDAVRTPMALGGGVWLRKDAWGYSDNYNSGYRISLLRNGNDSTRTLSINAHRNATSQSTMGEQLASKSITLPSADSAVMWVKARAIGNVIEAVAWADGTAEPAYGDATYGVSVDDTAMETSGASKTNTGWPSLVAMGSAGGIWPDDNNSELYPQDRLYVEFLSFESFEVPPPYDIPVSPAARYRSLSLPLNNDASVTSWPDESGNGYNMSIFQGTPLFKTDGINGYPAVSMGSSSMRATWPSRAQPETVAIIMQIMADNNVYHTFMDGGGSGSRRYTFFNSAATSPADAWGMFAGGSVVASSTGQPFPSQPRLVMTRWNGGSSQLIDNGTLKINASPGTNPSGGITVGSRFSSPYEFAGVRVLEVLVWDRNLTAQEEEDLEKYTQYTYGIDLGYDLEILPEGEGHLAATATIYGEGLAIYQGSGDISATISLDANGLTIRQGEGDVSAATSLDANGLTIRQGDGDVSAATSLDANGLTIRQGDGEITAISSLDATGLGIRQGSGDISATTSLDANGLTIRQGEGEVSASVTLLGTGFLPSGDPEGQGYLSANVTLFGEGQSIRLGDGDLSATVDLNSSGITIRQGEGDISALASLLGFGSAPESIDSGTGHISAVTTLEGVGFAIYQGTGSIEVDFELEGSGITVRQGTGLLVATVTLYGHGRLPDLASVIWNGSAWVTPLIWDGSNWIPMKVWNGVEYL